MSDIQVRVVVALTVPLPASEQDRLTAYGTADVAECIDIDLDTDAAAFFMDADYQVLSVEAQL